MEKAFLMCLNQLHIRKEHMYQEYLKEQNIPMKNV